MGFPTAVRCALLFVLAATLAVEPWAGDTPPPVLAVSAATSAEAPQQAAAEATSSVAARPVKRHLRTGTAPTEGVTGLPADVTPLLSLAGTWQPIADEHLDTSNPDDAGGISNPLAANIALSNGREGMVVAGKFYTTSCPASITPVSLAILAQQPDGTLRVATSAYVADPKINGAGHVLIADFNQDGIDDLFLPAFMSVPTRRAPAPRTCRTRQGPTPRTPSRTW